MLSRCLLFLLLSTTVAFAQSTDQWQNYFHSYRLLGGAEGENMLWLATENSILQIDLESGAEELLHYQNSPLPLHIYDIQDLPGNNFVLLIPANTLLYYRDGEWESHPLGLSSHVEINRIVGTDPEGRLLMATFDRIYRLELDGSLSYLPYAELLENDFVHLVAMDQRGYFWLAGYPNLLCFDADGDVILSQDLGNHSPYDLEVDASNNAWLLTNRGLFFWDAGNASLSQVPGIGHEEMYPAGGDIVTTLDHSIIVQVGGQVLHIQHEGATTWKIDELSDNFSRFSVPARWGYQTQNGDRWYLDDLSRLRSWHPEGDTSPRLWPTTSWLPLGELEGLSLDPQGKLWIGGFNQTAYLMGGRWHSIPIDTISFSIPRVTSIAFNELDQPIVGNVNFAFFGFPSTDVLEWNGSSWDSLEQAVVSNMGFPVTDLLHDRDGNLWALQEFMNLFSVRNEGRWYHFKASDFTGDITAFHCLYEDPDGGMWIGTDNGLLFYDGFEFIHTTAAEMGIGSAQVSGITIDKEGTMWIAGGIRGIWREGPNGWIQETLPWEEDFSPYLHKIITGTYPELWAAPTFNGVLHYDGEKWTHLTPDNSGLASVHVTNILHDPRGRTWFTSPTSLSVLHSDSAPIQPFILPTEQTLRVFPNPGCCQFEVHWQASQPGEFDLGLYDAQGRLVRQWSTWIEASDEYSFQFQTHGLPPATYSLNISQDGTFIGSSLLVVIQ